MFEEAGDALRGIAPPGLGPIRLSARRYGLKAWFDDEKQHYEAQVIGASAVEDATVLAIEVGFHAEHPKAGDNETVLARLVGAERSWRSKLGRAAVAGPFLGRQTAWRRLSETWPDPDLGDPELAFEIAARLTDYISAIEPVLRRAARTRAGTIDSLALPS